MDNLKSGSEIVDIFVDLLLRELERRQAGIDIWMDRRSLKPGESWNEAIRHAMLNSVGMLFFVSPDAMKSYWIRDELKVAAADETRLVVPIVIAPVDDLPSVLGKHIRLDISQMRFDSAAMHPIASRLASNIDYWLRRNPEKAPLSEAEASEFAAAVADGRAIKP